jgi:hypothetical protein
MASVDPPIDRLTVTNQRPMTGGADRPAKAISPADLARLKEQLMARARDEALSKFLALGGAAKSVPPDTLQLRVESENYQPPVDAEGEQLSGTMTVAASIVAWDNEGSNSLNALVQKMLLSSFGPEYELPLSQMRLPPPEVIDSQNQRMRVRVRADALVVHTLNPDQLALALRGKSGSEARTILQGVPGLAGAPRIDINPSWAPRAFRIEVAVAAPK